MLRTAELNPVLSTRNVLNHRTRFEQGLGILGPWLQVLIRKVGWGVVGYSSRCKRTKEECWGRERVGGGSGYTLHYSELINSLCHYSIVLPASLIPPPVPSAIILGNITESRLKPGFHFGPFQGKGRCRPQTFNVLSSAYCFTPSTIPFM
jgi:hypothetical protein